MSVVENVDLRRSGEVVIRLTPAQVDGVSQLLEQFAEPNPSADPVVLNNVDDVIGAIGRIRDFEADLQTWVEPAELSADLYLANARNEEHKRHRDASRGKGVWEARALRRSTQKWLATAASSNDRFQRARDKLGGIIEGTDTLLCRVAKTMLDREHGDIPEREVRKHHPLARGFGYVGGLGAVGVGIPAAVGVSDSSTAYLNHERWPQWGSAYQKADFEEIIADINQDPGRRMNEIHALNNWARAWLKVNQPGVQEVQEQEDGYFKPFGITVESPDKLNDPTDSSTALLRERFKFALDRGVPVNVYYREVEGVGTLAVGAVVTEATLQETGQKLNIAIVFDAVNGNPLILNIPEGTQFGVGYIQRDGVLIPIVTFDNGGAFSTFGAYDNATGTYPEIQGAESVLGEIDTEGIGQTQIAPPADTVATEEPFQGLKLAGYEQGPSASVAETLAPFLTNENFPSGLEGNRCKFYYSNDVLREFIQAESVQIDNPERLDEVCDFIFNEVRRMANLGSDKMELVSVITDPRLGAVIGSGRIEGNVERFTKYVVTSTEFDQLLASLNQQAETYVYYQGWKSDGRQETPDTIIYFTNAGHLVMISEPLTIGYRGNLVAGIQVHSALVVLSDSATRATGKTGNWDVGSAQTQPIYDGLGLNIDSQIFEYIITKPPTQ